MQARAVIVDGIAYEWHEYLLFNPWRGFRYLTQYNRAWDVVPGVDTLSKVKVAASVCTLTLEPVPVKEAVLHSPKLPALKID